MSQAIIKLQKGDKVSEVKQQKLFKDGSRDIQLDLIQKNANYNIQNYLESKSWNRKKKQAFMSAYSDMINSINNGTISQRDSGRQYIDSSGRISNTKGKGFDAYGEAAYFLDSIIDRLPDYSNKSEDTTPKKEKYNSNMLINSFRNRFFGGNEPDMEFWQNKDEIDPNTGKRGTINRATSFASIIDDQINDLKNKDYDFEGSAYSDKNDLIERLSNASKSLRDGTFNNDDYASLLAIGIPGEQARLLFSEDNLKEKGAENSNLEQLQQQKNQEDLKSQEENLQREVDLSQKDRALKEVLQQEYINPGQRFQERELYLPKPNYDKVRWGNSIKGKANDYYSVFEKDFSKYNPFDNQSLQYNNGIGTTVNWLNHISNNLDYLGSNIGEEVGDGYYLLPYSINKDKATAILYNPKTRHMVERAIYRIPKLWEKIQNERRAEYLNSNFNFKSGGVLQFQSGGYFRSRNIDKYNDDLLKASSETPQEDSKKSSSSSTNKKSLSRVVDTGDLTSTDITRIGAAAADVASIVASFIPGYGTAASAGLGLGSSLATAYADIAEDGLQGSDIWNFGKNLAMDVVGLVPGFGAAGKSSKIVKNLVRYVPKITTILSAQNLVDKDVLNSLGKITSDEKLTVDDWKNISTALATFAGLSRMGAASMKARAYRNAAKTGDRTIKVKSGEMKRITPQQLEELQKKENLTEANKYLKGIKGFENDELEYSFNRGKNPLKAQFYHTPKTGEHYDFNFSRTTKKGDKPFGSRIDERIYRGAVNSEIGGFSIPGIKVPSWMKISNPYKITKAPQKKKSKRDLIDEAIQRQFDTNPNFQFRKEGGQIIKAAKGIRNVIGDPNLNWDSNIYNTEGFLNTLKKINPGNLDTYNNMQNTYSTLGFSNTMPGDNLSFNQKVADYQKSFQQNTDINNLTMADLVSRGLVKGRGNSSDKGVDWTPDGLAGTQTWLRHLGTKDVTPEMLTKMNSILKDNGVEAFINNNTGMVNYRLLPVQKPQTNLSEMASTIPLKEKITIPTVSSKTYGGTSNSIDLEKIAKFLPNKIGLSRVGRLAGNIWNTNRVTKETKAGLKPLLRNTYNLQKNEVGDLATQNAYYNRAAQLESFAGRPRTSDASLQLAGSLEANDKGNELRSQGDLADNGMRRESLGQIYQIEADNIARRTQTANENTASILGINKAKHDLEAVRKSTNWTSLDSFLKEKEFDLKNLLNRQNQFDQNIGQQKLASIIDDPRLNSLYQKIIDGTASTQEQQEFYNLKKDLQNQYNQEANKLYADIYGLRYNPIKRYSPQIIKNGGKVDSAIIKARTNSAKLFQENIQNTIKNHIKMIDNLSSVTKQLILKSMTL